MADLDAAIAHWLEVKEGRSGSRRTLRAYTDTLASFRVACRLADTDLDGQVNTLARLAATWAAHGDPAPNTYNQRLAIVSSFYDFAFRLGLLEVPNPISRVQRRRVQAYTGAVALDPADVAARLKAIDRSTLIGARDYALLLVAFQTGRRLAELAGLRVGDIAPAGAGVTLTWRHCKGNKLMRDTLPALVATPLLAYLHLAHGRPLAALAPDDPVWINLSRRPALQGQDLRIDGVQYIVSTRLGVSKVHATRHTFALAMDRAGASVTTIRDRLGHESLETTSRYLRALGSADNPQAVALAALFLGEPGPAAAR